MTETFVRRLPGGSEYVETVLKARQKQTGTAQAPTNQRLYRACCVLREDSNFAGTMNFAPSLPVLTTEPPGAVRQRKVCCYLRLMDDALAADTPRMTCVPLSRCTLWRAALRVPEVAPEASPASITPGTAVAWAASEPVPEAVP